MCSTSCSAKGWPIKHNGVQTQESFMVFGVMESEETVAIHRRFGMDLQMHCSGLQRRWLQELEHMDTVQIQ